MEPVIYCVLACLVLLDGVPHRTLLQLPDARVVTLGDAEFAALRRQDPTVPVLYFSPEDYNQAVDGLATGEVRTVLERRLREWSPRVLEHASFWLFRRGQTILGVAATAEQAASGATQRVLADHVAGLLDVLTRINGQGRFGATTLDELLVLAMEKEALILEEVEAAGNPPPLLAEVAERTETADLLGQLLGQRGQSAYAGALPYVELWRGVFVAPADDALRGRLKVRWEPFVPWRDGVVARWKLRDLAGLHQQGRRTMVLYFDAGAFLEDLAELTQAQLERALSQREVALTAAPDAVRANYLAGLRLDALLALKIAAARAAREAPPLAVRLQARVTLGAARLVAVLAAQGTPPPGTLIAREAAWLRDMVRFADWGRAAGQPTLARWFDDWAASLRPLSGPLAVLSPPP